MRKKRLIDDLNISVFTSEDHIPRAMSHRLRRSLQKVKEFILENICDGANGCSVEGVYLPDAEGYDGSHPVIGVTVEQQIVLSMPVQARTPFERKRMDDDDISFVRTSRHFKIYLSGDVDIKTQVKECNSCLRAADMLQFVATEKSIKKMESLI